MTTALLAFDAANPTISAAAMVSHGAIVAPVYIRGNPGGFQPSDAERVIALRKAGLAPWPNWESSANYFATCSLAGATWAGKDAREAALRLGFPDDGTISLPFSFDYQVPATGFKDALDKLRACQDGLGDGFVATSYGQSALIDYFGRNGFGQTGHWLMASTWGLPNYNIGSEHVAMVQSHHADGSWFNTPIPGTDANTVTRPEILGAWWPEGSEYALPAISIDDVRAELADFGRAVLTGKDSGFYTHDRFPAWVGEPGLRDLAKRALSQDDVKAIAASVAKAVPGASQDAVEAAIKAVLTQGVGA